MHRIHGSWFSAGVGAAIFLQVVFAGWAQSNTPGVIQVEDYNIGGEGVAYHDGDAGNNGGAYRADDVDIEVCASGGFNIGWVSDDEWLKYTILATNSAWNRVRYRLASGWTGHPFAIRFSLDDRTVDVLNIYQTGNWQAWTNVMGTMPFFVAAGVHTVRLDIITGGFNIDAFELTMYTNATPAYLNPAAPVADRVEDLLGRMTLDEKIGQMCLPSFPNLFNAGNQEKDITDYFIGALLNGGGDAPFAGNEPRKWANMTDRYMSYALQARLRIPLLFGTDAVHGHNNVYGATIFPHNIGLGAAHDEALIERAAQVTAVEVAATGIRWVYAPCIAVPRNEQWGRFYEGFAETPDRVGRYGAAAVRGFQGGDLSAATSVLACAKHFAGDGGTAWGTGTYNGSIDQGNTVCDEATFRAIHIAPYTNAIAAGVDSIMASYSSWNGVKMHANTYLLTDVLKGELGFQGFVVSDWAGIDQIPGVYTEDVITSVNAGLDMIMIPDRYKELLLILKAAVNSGSISTYRVDDAVRRILRVKFKLGLFERPYSDRSLLSRVGSAEHRAVARQAVRESVVVLQNQNDILPLRKDLARIHVAGKNANNIGNQCGGWSIAWQGASGDITVGTTLLEAITQTVSSATSVTFSEDGFGAAGADVGIVVVGETPYAEWYGDTLNPTLDMDDILTIDSVRASGVPVVVVLVSGRPLMISDLLPSWDAAVAAWLPGTEGQGVADVLFGDVYPAGRLAHTWPLGTNQLPITVGDEPYDPLFAFDYAYRIEPVLSAMQTASQILFAWPYGSTGFTVQSSASLASPIVWTNVPVSPEIVGKTYNATIGIPAGTSVYYRLKRP